MGLRYILFRVGFEVKRKSGWLKRSFPVNPSKVNLPSIQKWKSQSKSWPWGSREELVFQKKHSAQLESSALDILSRKILLFNSIPYSFKKQEDWYTHPETGFQYDKQMHWTQIPDLSREAGDIKYVWEKSRFTYLHTVLRYDYHFDQDHADWVFSEMESWIAANPINCGPNYRCSQEISLRVFNWLGALVFYRQSPTLTEKRWEFFMHHIYWQMHHVWQNIQFSRIAVRNNHAITETLALYIYGSLFPEAPDAEKWKTKGKSWFEEEVAYQIYEDGSYLQFSMNYHRVVVQLLTLAIRFTELRGDRFADVVYQRANASLQFLRSFQDPISGELPNYGANDGALFFQFTDKPFRNYTDQLNALEAALKGNLPANGDDENANWFGTAAIPYFSGQNSDGLVMSNFPIGGFAGIKEDKTLTFFRAGNHKDRPSQADNLHVDLWHEGENIFRDAGSYKYNAAEADQRYFFGSRSHNLVMVNGQDQMKKGPRFVWLNWTQATFLKTAEDQDFWYLEGEISAFHHVNSEIKHRRKITKSKSSPSWVIEDFLTGTGTEKLELLWHPSPTALKKFEILVEDSTGKTLNNKQENGWYSGLYGLKEESTFFVYESQDSYFKTTIRPKN